MTEVWLPVVGYEGLYEVSSHGRVRSLDRVLVNRLGISHRRKGAIKGMYEDPASGYLRVNLGDGSRYGRVHKVQHLVADAFLGTRPDRMVLRHLNGDPTDNRVRNLAWGTSTENSLDTVAHGRNRNAAKTHCDYGHELTATNLVKSADKGRGQRACRACHRARARVATLRASGIEVDYQAVADEYFRNDCCDVAELGVELPYGDTVKRPNQHADKPECIRGHLLMSPNLNPGSLRRGIRTCRACHRGREVARRHARAGHVVDLQAVTDDCYRKIMKT